MASLRSATYSGVFSVAAVSGPTEALAFLSAGKGVMTYSYDRRFYSYYRRADTEGDLEQKLASFGRVIQGMEEKSAPYLQNQGDRYNLLNIGSIVRSAFEVAHRVGARLLFWSILQTYQLNPKDRKVIEQANRVFAKDKMNRMAPEKTVAAYNKTLAEFKLFYEVAKRALSAKKHSDEDSGTTLKSGSFTLVNTGGFPDKTMQEAGKVVHTAERMLRAKGLGKVCYGNIQVTNTIGRSTRTLAFYVQTTDEMFVRANLKGKQGPAVTSVLHELGHRLHLKYLSGKNADIRQIYRVIADKFRDQSYDMSKMPAPGATILGDKNEPWVYDGTTYSKGGTRYLSVHLESDPSRKGGIQLADWLIYSGGGSSFVSTYAKKNHEENFAEMLAAYCEDRLPEDQVALLVPVLE